MAAAIVAARRRPCAADGAWAKPAGAGRSSTSPGRRSSACMNNCGATRKQSGRHGYVPAPGHRRWRGPAGPAAYPAPERTRSPATRRAASTAPTGSCRVAGKIDGVDALLAMPLTHHAADRRVARPGSASLGPRPGALLDRGPRPISGSSQASSTASGGHDRLDAQVRPAPRRLRRPVRREGTLDEENPGLTQPTTSRTPSLPHDRAGNRRWRATLTRLANRDRPVETGEFVDGHRRPRSCDRGGTADASRRPRTVGKTRVGRRARRRRRYRADRPPEMARPSTHPRAATVAAPLSFSLEPPSPMTREATLPPGAEAPERSDCRGSPATRSSRSWARAEWGSFTRRARSGSTGSSPSR